MNLSESTKTVGFAAFSYSEKLKGVDLAAVENIEGFAFNGCKIHNLFIPSSVKSIGREAFDTDYFDVDNKNEYYSSDNGVLCNKNKTELIRYPMYSENEEYIMPNSFKRIYMNAFEFSTSLKNVVLNNQINTVPYNCFGDCKSLESVVLNEGIAAIESNAFNRCSNLKYIIIPKSVNSIEYFAFTDCENLEIVVLNPNMKFCENPITDAGRNNILYGYKGSSAETYAGKYGIEFQEIISKCESGIHKYIENNETVKKPTCISEGYNYNECIFCRESSNVIIPPTGIHEYGEGVITKEATDESFGEITYTCIHCNNKKTEEIQKTTDFNCIVKEDDTVEITKYIGEAENVIIPERIGGRPVTSLGQDLFVVREAGVAKPQKVVSLTIPDTVVEIKRGVCWNNSNLKQLNLGNGVKTIGDFAFSNSSITSLELPQSIEEVGYYAFSYCESLNSITMPDKAVKIIDGAFLSSAYYNDDSNWNTDDSLYLGKIFLKSESYSKKCRIAEGTLAVAENALSSYTETLIIPETVQQISRQKNVGKLKAISVLNDSLSLDVFAATNAVIYGHTNSSAQHFCENNGNEFVDISSVDCSAFRHIYNDDYYCMSCGDEYNIINPAELDVNKVAKRITAENNNKILTFIPEHSDYYDVRFITRNNESYNNDFEIIEQDGETLEMYFDSKNHTVFMEKGKNYNFRVHNRNEYGFEIAKHEHSISVTESVIQEPSCTSSGSKMIVYYCDVCKNKLSQQYEESDKTDHTAGAPVKENCINPTCVTAGSYELAVYCQVCGIELSRESFALPTVEHSFEANTVKPATCVEPGEELLTCTVCGKTQTRVVSATGHDYVAVVTAPTCAAQGYTTYTCSVCGDSYVSDFVALTGIHNFDKGVVTKAATTTAQGIKTYTCTVCGKTRTEAIAKLAKKANTLTAKGKTVTVKFSKLKKNSQNIARKKAITVSKAQGNVAFIKLSGNKKILVTKNGKIVVMKGLKEGTYKVKVKVTASGNAKYKPAKKTVTVTIKVK